MVALFPLANVGRIIAPHCSFFRSCRVDLFMRTHIGGTGLLGRFVRLDHHWDLEFMNRSSRKWSRQFPLRCKREPFRS